MNAPTLLERLAGYLPLLAHGAATTLLVSLVAIAAGFVLGAALLGLSRSRARLAAGAAAAYVSFFRGTPLLVQLLMLFYLPSAMGLELPPLAAAMLAMTLNSAAFQCEILRAGLASIPAGQIEAAASFGIARRQVFRHIELPQIARAVWPAVVSEAIDVVKNSAIVSVIAVADLARVGRQLVASTYRPLEVFMAVGVVYLVMTAAIFALGSWLGARMGGGRAGARRIVEQAAGGQP